MTIAYVYHLDAESRAIQSGRPFAILSELRNSEVNVLPIFPLRHTCVAARALGKLASLVAGKRYLMDRQPAMLKHFAKEARQRLTRHGYDVVFCPSTLPVTFLEIEKPVTICADATFHSMIDYYASFSRLPRGQRESAERLEYQALRRCSLIIYSSEWAARSAISHYGIPKERVIVLPSGANFGAQNIRGEVMAWIEKRSRESIRLLFVGKDWERKGGDIAFETLRLLLRSGYRATLDIAGCDPPANVAAHPNVTPHGHVHINNGERRALLNSLFVNAHFLVVPSRAEAFGMVFCEANAFGIPAISTATGGIPTIIRDGVNGYALPLSAEPSEYANLIGMIASDPLKYEQLAKSSFAEFDRRLNWKVWIKEYMQMVSVITAAKVGQLT